MQRTRLRARGAAIALCALTVLASPFCQAQQRPSNVRDEPSWDLIISPYTQHFSNDDHRHVYLLGLQRNQLDGAMWGLSLFRNSFGQGSGYAYYGHRWDALFGVPELYGDLSAGIIYGYRGEFKDKVPFNHGGFAPAIIPALGYRVTPKDALQLVMLGKNALLFAYVRAL